MRRRASFPLCRSCMEKEEEVDQRQGIEIKFEISVGIRALLIYIDWQRIDKYVQLNELPVN